MRSARYKSEFTQLGQEWMVFEALLRPFIVFGLRSLKQHPAWEGRLSDKARDDIAGALMGRLSWHCTRTIAYEMKHARTRGELWGASPEERYELYINDILPSRRLTLLSQYPMLARLLAVLMVNFERCAIEFLDRFESDCGEIHQLLGMKQNLPIARITPFLSDPHNGGRTVWRATFTDGTTRYAAYYKPRSLAVDVVWANLLLWVKEQGLQPDLVPTSVLGQGRLRMGPWRRALRLC